MDTDNKEFTLALEDPCPCGSGKKFGECCAKALKDGCWPETAEALMRARYTAYALHDYQYLVDTTLPSERDKDFSAEKRSSARLHGTHSAWTRRAQTSALARTTDRFTNNL